jgi:hypothetical protein
MDQSVFMYPWFVETLSQTKKRTFICSQSDYSFRRNDCTAVFNSHQPFRAVDGLSSRHGLVCAAGASSRNFFIVGFSNPVSGKRRRRNFVGIRITLCLTQRLALNRPVEIVEI